MIPPPKIDVLLAVYNGAQHLPELLESLKAQSHHDWRLILRDDGSSDGSPDLVRDWATLTRRELLVVEDGDARVGPADSFARLLAWSDAPYFAFCDQDDVWEEDKLTRLVDAAVSAGDGVILAHCDLAVVDENLAPVAPSFWRQQDCDAALRRAAQGHRARLLFQNPVTGCAMLGNAALRRTMLPMPDDISMHDWWAALAAAYRGRIVPVEAPLVRYRQHDGNAVGARTRTLSAMVQRVLREPAAGVERTNAIFSVISRQAAAAHDRFGDAMTPAEQAFARNFAQIGAGLRRAGGWRLLFWALAARRRLPLAAQIVIATMKRSASRTKTTPPATP